MILTEETSVPLAALPVASFKDHLRLGTGFADDGLQDAVLESFVGAALAAIEARTGKALIARDFALTREAWSDHGCQPLPLAPVSAVTSIETLTVGGTATLWDGAAWRLIADMQRPAIEALGGAMPTIPDGGTGRIRFTAGFGPAFSDVPHDLAQAVMMLAAHYYEYRHDTSLDGGCMPFGVSALIERWRTIRLFGRGAGA